MSSQNGYIYLSHFMDSETPLYGGGKGISIKPDRSIENGDTANTKILSLHNHSGTHIDYPNHFFSSGLTSESYEAEQFIFDHPFLILLSAEDDKIISITEKQLRSIPTNTNFLIIKTGFGKYRTEERYWKNNPGLSPELANQLKHALPGLKVIGMDFISITSFQNRELGRKAHREFLGGDNPILLVEDMQLELINDSPQLIMCFPLMVKGLDGAPVTIIAKI